MRNILFSLAAVIAVTGAGLANAQSVKRTLTQVTPDIWRFDNKFHASIVVVTDEGVMVGDPINSDAASWLKAEIAARFDKPVKYLVMSHSHADHASGGQVFADTATVVTHENFKAAVDTGRVDTAAPDVTFSDNHTFSMGGKTFEVTYLGPGHGDDMIVTVVRPDNVAFVVDVISPKRVPYRNIPVGSLDALLDQIRAVEALDFEILLPGHAATGTHADATEARVYLETLRDRVQAALDAGKSAEEIVETVRMPEYAHWGAYDRWIALNVEGMVRLLSK